MKKLFILTIFSFLFFSCNQPNSTFDEHFENNPTQTNYTNINDLPGNKIGMKVETRGIQFEPNNLVQKQNSSRSILPYFSSLIYSITATATEDSSIILNQSNLRRDNLTIYLTDYFTWNIEIEATYTNNDDPENPKTFVIFTGNKENVVPKEDENIFVQMNAKLDYDESEEAKGNLNAYIGVEENRFNGYKMNVNFFNKDNNEENFNFYTGTSTISPIEEKEIELNSGWTISISDLKPGIYGLEYFIFTNEGLFVLRGESFFAIYAGMTTNRWVSESILDESGNYTLTENEKNLFSLSTIFVKGELQPGEDSAFSEKSFADDSNYGDRNSPLKTIQAAIKRCDNCKKENIDEFTIYVQGEFEIELASLEYLTISKKIKICQIPTTEEIAIEKPKIHYKSGNYYLFSINPNSTLTLENIIIDGTNTTNGAIITEYDSSNVILNNCEITNFSIPATSSSESVIKNNGVLQATNCKFQNNENLLTNGSGGVIYSTGINSKIGCTNCDFILNKIKNLNKGVGGAVYIDSSTTENKFINCNFKENKAIINESIEEETEKGENGSGGAVYISKSNVNFSNTFFYDNESTNNGSAISIIGKSIVNIDNSTIDGKSTELSSGVITEKSGGGIFVIGEDSSKEATLNIQKTTIKNIESIVNGGGIFLGSNTTGTFNGLTIENCLAELGGAIYSTNKLIMNKLADETINSIIKCTGSGGNGGAIYLAGGTDNSLEYLNIDECIATKLGGGIFVNAKVSLKNSTINNCKTTDATSGFGGGIYVKSGELITDELSISECSARSGGGINIIEGAITLQNTTIDLCKATDVNGGGIFYSASNTEDSLTTNDCIISNCSANNFGGGLYSTGKNVILSGGRITDCSAKSCGGGIYSNKSFNIEEMNITNCSITNEALSNGGAGIYISKSSSSNITANINNIQISNCSIPTNYVKGNAIFIKEGYSSGVLTVNIEDSIIGIDKSESFTKGTKPTTADVPYNLSVSDGANNGGINVINIEGNSESNNTVVNFKNTKISYNQCKEQTVYLNYAKATFDENTELLANYVEDYCGEIYIYQKGIVDFEGKIHHNFSSYALINNYAATAIRLYGSNTVLNIKNGSEIYDNDLGHTPSDTYYVSAIYNHQGTINFEGGTMQNNYNNSIHCYEIYNNGTLNISGNAKVGDPTETSKYNSIYLAEHAGTQSTITINDDITSDFVGRIYLSDYQYVLDTQVLDGSKVSDNNHKFEMVNINYSIKTDGKLEEKISTSSASTMYTAISDTDIQDVTLNLVTNQTIDIPDSIPLNGGVMPEYALTIPPGKTLTIKGTSDTPATLTIPYSGDALIVEGDLILENVIITANVHWSAITIKDNGKLFLNDGVVIKDINFGGSSFGAICLSGNNSYLEMNEGALIQNARSNSTGAVELANSTAIFVMNGGTIENCILGSSHNSLGGGVCINNGTFTMNGGTIHNNSTSTSNADSYGGGVYLGAGTFIMNDGNITANTTYLDHGDDLYVKSGATFTMTGGTIGTAVISNSATYNQTGGTITNESRE